MRRSGAFEFARVFVLGIVCTAFAGSRQAGEAPRAPVVLQADERYPPRRHPTAIHFFNLDGDVKPDLLRQGLAELDPEGRARIVHGPISSKTRSGMTFLVVEAPASSTAKDVQKALRKGALKTEALAGTIFVTDAKPFSDLLGYTATDLILGMDGDMRWFEEHGGVRCFFYVPGKIGARSITTRIKSLYGPFQQGDVGRPVEDWFVWPLAEPLDAPGARKAERAIAKLSGVVKAEIDLERRALTVTLLFDEIRIARGTTPAEGSASPAMPLLFCDTNAILDALEKHKIVPAGAGTTKSAGGGDR